MAKIKELTSAYVNYYDDESSEPFGIRLITLNGRDSKNFYKTDYNTYIPNAVNFIIGLLGHYGNKRSRPEESVYVSNKVLAKYIGVSYAHASVVMNQCKSIFGLHIEERRGRGGARRVKLSKQLIEFMKVFSEEDLHEYIIKYNVSEENIFAAQQVYRYLGWGISPGQLTPEKKAQRKEYMNDQERKNWLHYAFTSHHKPETRINMISEHEKLLSDVEKRQLESIKVTHIPGTKLVHYWHKVLIKLQQKISYLIELAKKNKKESPEQQTSNNNENQTQGDSVSHNAATKVAQKKSEDPDIDVLQFMGKVITSWNERAERNNLPAVKRVTKERYNSLLEIREEYSEKEIFEALNKIEVIHQGKYDHKFTFERFIQSDTILFALEYDSNSSIAVETDFMSNMFNSMNIDKRISLVPEFRKLTHLNTWLSKQN